MKINDGFQEIKPLGPEEAHGKRIQSAGPGRLNFAEKLAETLGASGQETSVAQIQKFVEILKTLPADPGVDARQIRAELAGRLLDISDEELIDAIVADNLDGLLLARKRQRHPGF